jgi:hypothetical protein
MGVHEGTKEVLARANNYSFVAVGCTDCTGAGLSRSTIYLYTILVVIELICVVQECKKQKMF